jgi:hypothetical protein
MAVITRRNSRMNLERLHLLAPGQDRLHGAGNARSCGGEAEATGRSGDVSDHPFGRMGREPRGIGVSIASGGVVRVGSPRPRAAIATDFTMKDAE